MKIYWMEEKRMGWSEAWRRERRVRQEMRKEGEKGMHGIDGIQEGGGASKERS